VEWHAALVANRLVVLRDLVILGHVRIEVVLPVKLAYLSHLAVKHQPGEGRHTQRRLVHHGERSGVAEAHRTSVGVGFRAIFHGATAEHLAARLELDVNF